MCCRCRQIVCSLTTHRACHIFGVLHDKIRRQLHDQSTYGCRLIRVAGDQHLHDRITDRVAHIELERVVCRALIVFLADYGVTAIEGFYKRCAGLVIGPLANTEFADFLSNVCEVFGSSNTGQGGGQYYCYEYSEHRIQSPE